MVHYLINRPNISVLFTYLGIILLLMSGFVLSSSHVPNAQADDCTHLSSFYVPGDSYTDVWNVKNWLTVANVPIGPSNWDVEGHTKTPTGDFCFHENWELESVVWSSTSDPRRGKIINRATSVLDGGFEGSTLSFTTPSNPNEAASVQSSGCSRFNIFGVQCQTDSFTRDSAFDGTTSFWNSMGLYGIMRNSKDSLNASRSYLPVQWQVHGTF